MIKLILADITQLKVDVIVNAANSSLLGGGGVDGAIHRAAGPDLLEECRNLNGCPTGEAKITKGYNLPSKFVIHTVGPVWHGGNSNETTLLANCYYNSLLLAQKYKLNCIAFPNISTGVYGYPKSLAADIAINTVRHFLESSKVTNEIIFAVFDLENFKIYEEKLND